MAMPPAARRAADMVGWHLINLLGNQADTAFYAMQYHDTKLRAFQAKYFRGQRKTRISTFIDESFMKQIP
ncbi:MAG: hypothetical protein V4454_02685 [Pseudomonadota bacterium]